MGPAHSGQKSKSKSLYEDSSRGISEKNRSAFFIDHTCGKPVCGHPVCISMNKNRRPQSSLFKPMAEWKPREKLPHAWSRDLFMAIAVSLGNDCLILEKICVKFCSIMGKDDFWIFLLRRLTNWDSVKRPVTNMNYRQFFLQYAPYSWDTSHKASLDIRTFNVSGSTITGEVAKKVQWKTVKCLEPLPSNDGDFWTFAIRVNKCETKKEEIGFGILPLQTDDVYKCDSAVYPLNTSSNPWLWHVNGYKPRAATTFGKNDLLVLAGIVHSGKHFCRFFKNGYMLPKIRIKIVCAKTPRYPHISFVSNESVTIRDVPFEDYKQKLLLSYTHKLGKGSNDEAANSATASGSDSDSLTHTSESGSQSD